jgi:hypothetical protein
MTGETRQRVALELTQQHLVRWLAERTGDPVPPGIAQSVELVQAGAADDA